MITNRRIEKCEDIKTLRDWKATKEKTILRSQDFIAQCEHRMEQVKFEKQNQITMEDLAMVSKASAKKPGKRTSKPKPRGQAEQGVGA